MPSPTPTQTVEERSNRIVQMMPNQNEKASIAWPLVKFLQKELLHWQANLQERQKEGEYYLDWLALLEPDVYEANGAETFLELIREKLPKLCKQIEALSSDFHPSGMETILSIQQNYLQFCDLYDRIKLQLLEQMEWGSSWKIF